MPGWTEEFTYNPMGLRDQDLNGRYLYDDLHRLAYVQGLGDGEEWFGYDLSGNRPSWKHTLQDDRSYRYDGQARLENVRTPAEVYCVDYVYDAEGRRRTGSPGSRST